MGIAQLTRYEDLIRYLADGNVPRREDHAERSVEVPVLMPPLTGSVFMRWEQRLPYVQVLHPFVLNVPEARIADVETAITRVNETLPAPGLGFHHDKRFVYMRRCVPVYADGISATSFQKQVTQVLETARELVGPMTKIVGGQPGAEILRLSTLS